MTNQQSRASSSDRQRKKTQTRSKRSTNARNSRPANNGKGRGGNPKASLDRYLVLAREAAASGDHVEAENCRQHAEHYLRVINAAT